ESPHQQRIRTRRIAIPRARRLSARRPPPRVRGQRRRTARAHSHVPPDPPEIARPRREYHERRLARRISRMGWVREQQGRTRSPEQDTRERAARSRRRRRRGRPGRSPDADAPGCVPGTGHQRPATPGGHAAVLGVARRPRPVADHRPEVRGPRHRLGGARMKRQELVFEQPRELFASTPVETEHGARDAVRLLVTTPSGHRHAAFADLPRFLSAGDLLVANESATLAASLEARGPCGPYTLDLSTRYADGLWLAWEVG